jgi:hypothetical protein
MFDFGAVGAEGAFIAAVPRIIPASVIAGVVIVGDIDNPPGPPAPPDPTSIAFARPKSSTFTVPSTRTLMLAGLRSRLIPASVSEKRNSGDVGGE